MAYIGIKPNELTKAIATYDTFTGDGSTVAFTLTQGAASANDLTVVVNNVRQEPGASKAYTLVGTKTLTFTVAPAAADVIYAINRTQIETIRNAGSISSGVITGQPAETAVAAADNFIIFDASASAVKKITNTNLTKGLDINGQTAETATAAADELLIYDASASAVKKVTNTNITKGLDFSGQTELSALAADDDLLLVYDTSATTIKKIQKSNIATTLTYAAAAFTGDGSDTTFTINSGRAVNDVLVIVNGAILIPTTDYTISGTTLTFITAPAVAAEISVRYLPI